MARGRLGRRRMAVNDRYVESRKRFPPPLRGFLPSGPILSPVAPGQALANSSILQRRIDTYLGIAAGIAAPLVYASAVIAGGWVTPGYSHLASTISELTTAGQPYAEQLDDVFVAYNLLLACFAACLPVSLSAARQTAIRADAAVLLVLSLAGVGMVTIFPVSAPGLPLTPTARMHIILAAIASISTMLAIALTAYALWQARGWRLFTRFSAMCLAIVAGSGIWTATAVAGGQPLAGLAERLTIGTFMAWLLAFALTLAASAGRSRDA